MHFLHIKITKFSDLWFILGAGYWTCPVYPVGFMDLSYGVKFEVRKHFIREGAYFTGVLGAGYKFQVTGCRFTKMVESFLG